MLNQIKINAGQLITAFELSKKIVNGKGVLPIMDGFYVQIQHEKQKAVITGTDLNNSIVLTLNCVCEKSFKFYLPLKLCKFIQKLEKNSEIEFQYESETFNLIVSSGKDKTKQTVSNFEDFPVVPKCFFYPLLGVDAKTFLDNVKTLSEFCANNEIRPELEAITLNPMKDNFEMVATDANLLVKLVLPGNCNAKKGSRQVGIPKLGVNILNSIPSKIKGDIELFVGVTQENIDTYNQQVKDKEIGFSYPKPSYLKFYFEYDNVKAELICQALDDKIPNYDAVIPTDNPIQWSFDKKSALKTMDKALLFANQANNQGVFSVSDSELKISSHDLDFEHTYAGSIPVKQEKTPAKYEIGFNLKYMTKCLETKMVPDNVSLTLSTPGRAGLVSIPNGVILIMPLIIDPYNI